MQHLHSSFIFCSVSLIHRPLPFQAQTLLQNLLRKMILVANPDTLIIQTFNPTKQRKSNPAIRLFTSETRRSHFLNPTTSKELLAVVRREREKEGTTPLLSLLQPDSQIFKPLWVVVSFPSLPYTLCKRVVYSTLFLKYSLFAKQKSSRKNQKHVFTHLRYPAGNHQNKNT